MGGQRVEGPFAAEHLTHCFQVLFVQRQGQGVKIRLVGGGKIARSIEDEQAGVRHGRIAEGDGLRRSELQAERTTSGGCFPDLVHGAADLPTGHDRAGTDA